MVLKKILFSVMLSLMLVSAYAINCYQCNSLHEPECQDLGAYKPHLTAGFYKECIDYDLYNGMQPFCRKTELRILEHDEHLKRTIRSCGWIKSRFECYKEDNEDHMETNCQCFEDGCNGSKRVKPFGVLGFSILGVACLFVSLTFE